MATFADLPQEILPLILRNIRKYQDLAALVLVNKLHQVFAIPLLYEQIFIYPWHKNGKQRVHSVFQTLANSPQLASHVKRIEVRDFPRGLKGSARDDLLELCLRGLNNCVNLISCTWTRDGAMNTEVLCALRDCPSLQSLTINGQHQWKYDPNILSQFVNIQELSIIMPSPVIVHVIERAEYAKLTSLSLICKSSTVINDEFLSTLATKTPNIQRLQLINCPKVSDDGVMKVLEHSVPGLSDLAIEGTSGAFNLDRFGATVSQSQLLGNLRALTLTAPLHTGPRAEETLLDWFGALTTALSSCSIERLHVYTSGDASRQNVPDTFVWSISDMHKSTLQRFSVHRMGVGLDAITYLASKCTKLEELFVTIPDNQLLDFGDSVSCSSSLRHIHLNITTSDGQSPMVVMRNVATDVVRKCGPSVVQFGCSTRVWQVVRTVQRNEQGELEVERTLGPYEAPEIPEQFLVVRA